MYDSFNDMFILYIIMMKYIVTGINRLSGQRERISNPLSADTAIRKKRALLESPARGRPFKYIRIKPFPFEEEWLRFENGGGRFVFASLVVC